MGDGAIQPPDFNSEVPFNVDTDEAFAEEADSFRELMKSDDHEQEKVQEDARSQVKEKEDSLKKLVQKKETSKETTFEDEEKGIDEEDTKKLGEKEEAEESEESRLSELEEGKEKISTKKESNLEEDKSKAEKGGKEGIERENSSKTSRMTKKDTGSDLTGEHSEDRAKDLDHELRSKESTVTDKAHAKATRLEEKQAQGNSFLSKKASPSLKPKDKTDKKKETQSIAANLALSATPLESSKSQKGSLNPKIEKGDLRKELEGLVKKIMEEAEIIKDGDETKTTISLDMPDSIFNRGEITISAFKYRPLEVNLQFKKFNHEGAKLLKQNQGDLKNTLTINSLKVHQLEIIE